MAGAQIDAQAEGLMGVKVREWKGAWWLFVDHQGQHKARRVGIGKEGKKAAGIAAIKIQARLAAGGELRMGDSEPAQAPTSFATLYKD